MKKETVKKIKISSSDTKVIKSGYSDKGKCMEGDKEEDKDAC